MFWFRFETGWLLSSAVMFGPYSCLPCMSRCPRPCPHMSCAGGAVLQEAGYFRLTLQTFVSHQHIPFGKVRSHAKPFFFLHLSCSSCDVKTQSHILRSCRSTLLLQVALLWNYICSFVANGKENAWWSPVCVSQTVLLLVESKWVTVSLEPSVLSGFFFPSFLHGCFFF